MSPNSHAASLSTAVQTEINELETKYNKNWTVSYLGASVDEALAAEDQKALSGFDEAVLLNILIHTSFHEIRFLKSPNLLFSNTITLR